MKLCLKSFAAGCIAATVGLTAVFAAGGIKSAVFNSNKVLLDGRELDLGGQQMISVVLEGETNASNYMPVRGVLEAMGYNVSWDGAKASVIVETPKTAAVPEEVKPSIISINKDGNTDIYTKMPTAHDLQGFWSVTEIDDSLVEFSFAECGNLRGHVVREGKVTDMYGTYTLSDSQINFEYKTLGSKVLDNPLTIDGQDIGISEDGKKLSLSLKDDDGTINVLVLTKNDEPVELKDAKVPTLQELNGTWIDKSGDIETSFTFENGKAIMSLNDGTADPSVFEGKAELEVISGHDHKRIHFSFESSAMGSDKTNFDKPLEMDFYAGIDGDKLILTNGIDVLALVKK